MLSCQDCEKYLEVFLDQALDVKESLDVEEHLRDCPDCTERAEAERLLRQFVRQQAREASLTPLAKLNMIRQAMDPPATPSWWKRFLAWAHPWNFATGMATAAVALLLMLGSWPFGDQTDDMTHRYVQEASMAYQTYKNYSMPLEVKASDDKEVVAWFNQRMKRPLHVPCITDQATKLMGGRLCRLFDRKSATFVYKRNGRDIFLFAFHNDGVSISTKHKVRLPNQKQDVYFQTVEGRPVAVWQRGGIVYSMVGDLNHDDLIQVADTMHYR